MQFLGLFAFAAAAAAAILKREDVSNAVKVTAVGDGLLVYDADLVYANHSLWVGSIRYQNFSAPLLVSPQPGNNLVYPGPSGVEYLYAFPAKDAPITTTIANNMGYPSDASLTPWLITDGILSYNHNADKFFACPTTEGTEGLIALRNNYKIFYAGNGTTVTDCVAVTLVTSSI